MKKRFNVSADCKPKLHYMADINRQLKEIRAYVDRGEYLTINRARQYGKTTTLRALNDFLMDSYLTISLDFQAQMSRAKFKSEKSFCAAFAKAFIRAARGWDAGSLKRAETLIAETEKLLRDSGEEFELVELFQFLSDICAVCEKPVVLIIDEADSAADNQIFLDFLAQLRGYYIDRDRTPTFQSVILAGVYDIRNLKQKLRPDTEHRWNSPWNIAADFTADMSLSSESIKGMLDQYEEDYHTNMDTSFMAEKIYDYTSGYPFLVSRLCKIIDEQLPGSEFFSDRTQSWTKEGLLEAVKLLLTEKNPLFESLTNKLSDYPRLRELLYSLLFTGQNIVYNPDDEAISAAVIFGFIKNTDGYAVITNRIFETRLYNFFLTASETQSSDIYRAALSDKNQFIQNGRLDMELVLQKFILHFDEIYGNPSNTFLEEDGRRYFLLYLRPIINGTGNYYIEAQTRNMERTDVIVDYHGEQFIIEMKIWRGDAYNTRGENQLAGYLDYYHLQKGYMLSFNFNKNKQTGVRHISVGDKLLIEAVV